MADVSMQASSFKAQCLAVLDEVERTHRPVVITKHGRAIARLVPIGAATPTMGSVTLIADTDDEFFSTDEPWNAG